MEEKAIDNLKKFGIEFQIKCISSLLIDKPFLERINDILDPSSFEHESHQWIVKTISQYFHEYRDLPTMNVFKVKVDMLELESLRKSVIEQLKLVYQKTSDSDVKFIKEQFLEFCKNQKLKGAILESVDCLRSGEYEKIKFKIDEAMKAGMERNVGHDYMVDIEDRMSITARDTIQTSWKEVDTIMDGGLGKGELGVIAACAGSGKSWCLAKLGAEAMKKGKNVVHYTLELNERYTGLRYDACFTGIDFQNIRNNKDLVKEKIKDITGKLKIKYYPIKTASASTIKAHAERVATLGTKVDMIIVDYADILRPTNSEGNSNSYSEAGGIYEELRTVAGELQIPIWVASQCNRSGLNDDILQANSIADSYRKIMTADFVLSLSRKVNDKVCNTARFHVIKNRFGPDGITFPAKMNAGCGDIQMYTESSKEGMEIINAINEGESMVKKMLSDKWREHISEDGEG